MSEQAAGSEPMDVIALPESNDTTFETPMDAWKALNTIKKESPAESADAATADQKLSDEGNAAADENQPHGEDQEADPANEPPIARPKSWTEAEDAEWKATPRGLQQKIVARELERDSALRRSQNEAAEKLKGITAKEQQAEQARQEYETKAQSALKILEREQLRDFPDIKTIADVTNLSVADPLRYLQWDAHQKEMVAAHDAVQQANQRQAAEQQTNWNAHIQKENTLAAEIIPDLADKDKGPALQKRAAERLGQLGFTSDELNDLASGKQKLSIYDHRLQQLIFSDLKLSDIQAAKTAIAAKEVPPVQRPGTSRPQGQGASDNVKALEAKLNNSGSIRDAFALYKARGNSARRAS